MPHLYPRPFHADNLSGLFAVPLDGPARRPDRPPRLGPVRIVACPDGAWRGSHFSRADWRAGERDGIWPERTVVECDGLTWCVVKLVRV